uniref:CDAN1-interacting nuclease 1 n=1 Tax=Globisporangium ultimum (strain ATCC 200006 / CBS 805.95 / DAOM BR144) TaxID=431595 RepID=K3X0R8_GLOUD
MLQLHTSRMARPVRRLAPAAWPSAVSPLAATAPASALNFGAARIVAFPHSQPLLLVQHAVRFNSSSASTAPAVVIHKPIPAKVKRKSSARHKKKNSQHAAAIAAKLNGSAANGAVVNGVNGVNGDKATQVVAPVTTRAINASQKQSEEEAALARAAKRPNGTGSAKLNGNAAAVSAVVPTSNSDNNKPMNERTTPHSSKQKKTPPPAVVAAEKEKEAQPVALEAAAATADVPKQPMALKDVQTDKITMTLKEIQSLQKTLPSVDEIAALVDKLRRESFIKGHTLFDLYRNYGNPFLDENFLIPGVLACCDAKKPADGIRIVRDMLNQGRKVDEKTLRALFDVCDATSAAEEVIKLWTLMDRAGMTLELKDYNRFLDICYRKEYLDGAIKVLKHLRLLRPVSVHTYMHWLLRASLVWRSDAFFDILMEMRLSGVEPEILSLTSLETGRKDRALTVMEGVRAVGLDPCFAMSSVYSSMQSSVYSNGPSSEALSAKDIKAAKSKFGDLKPRVMEWPVKPIPQLLETQAAGLILQQETFRRLKRHQVNRIDELLQMLPITANMTLNLRKQLQRMSLLVNTHRVRRDSRKINSEYMGGKTLIELSSTHNYPPVSLMRIILRERGLNTVQVKRALNNPSENLSKRDQYELKKAIEYDSVHKSDPFIGTPSYNADSLEITIEHFLKAQGIRVKTQEDLCEEQVEKYGRRVISPDVLLLDPVIVNGTPIRWIDAKNYYGAHIVSKRLISKQLASYVKEWGPGAIVFGMGYSDMFSVPGVICLDTTPFPKTRKEILKMRIKSLFYSGVNLLRWKKHLGSDLTQEYPPHVSYPNSPMINAKTPACDQADAEDEEQKHDQKEVKTTSSTWSASKPART